MKIVAQIKRFFRIILYTLSMYIVTHLVVFSLFPVVSMLIMAGKRDTSLIKARFSAMLLGIVRKKLFVWGFKNIEQGKGYVIVSNYPSFYTGFILMGLFPEASIIVHDFASRIPVLSPMLEHFGSIFANPKGVKFRRTRRAIDSRINEHQGKSIIILPEGKRTKNGQIQTFKRGFIYVLRQSRYDLLPVTLNGFYRLKPVDRIYLDPDARPEVIIHKPISYSLLMKMNDEEVRNMAESLIKSAYVP
jgi:1-acyl-sn-glycerol-3-phosphate acyltransferase